MRPFIAGTVSLNTESDVFRVRVFMYLPVRALSKFTLCLFARARMHTSASRSLSACLIAV